MEKLVHEQTTHIEPFTDTILLYDGSTQNAANPLSYTSDVLDKSPVTDTTACFSLWYYVDSESKFNLSLVYKQDTQFES